MGNPKQKWTSEEEEALRAGVKKHGTGKWKNIQKDPEFSHLLNSRSNIDLKDKWRNLTVSASNGSGPRDKSRSQKLKVTSDATAAPLPITQPTASAPISHDVSVDANTDDGSKCPSDGKACSKYNAMIYEALSTLKETNGSETSTIMNFIEQRHEVPPNFRRILTNRLRRLTTQDKLEKVGSCYRIKKEILREKVAPPKPKDILQQPREDKNIGIGYLGNTVDDATSTTANWIADAEIKSTVAAEAVKESERIMRMCEDTDAFLLLASEIFDKSSFGEIPILA